MSVKSVPVLPAVLAALALLASGCATSPRPTATLPATPDALLPLADTYLNCVQLVVDGRPVALPAEPPLTARINGGDRVAGFAGVNRFSGGFLLGETGALTWTPAMVTTRRAGPPERMELEDSFLKALQSATRLGIRGDGLVFQTDDGATRVEFRRPAKPVNRSAFFSAL